MNSLDKIINQYFSLMEVVHTAFGYEEDWVRIPLSDYREYNWSLNQEENGTGNVIYSESDKPLTKELVESGDFYSSKIYTQRFLHKWVYRTETHTLISIDTQTDGNKFLAIFDNSKETKEDLSEAYASFWAGAAL